MYKISFVIPVYNAEKYIQQCVDSILLQEGCQDNIEIILVDDGSKDNSFQICQEYSEQYDNVRAYKQSNSGANVARNLGMKQALGQWVCFVDSDDWVEPHLYKCLHKYLYMDWDIIMYSYKKVYPHKIQHYNSKIQYMEILDEDFEYMQLATLNRLKPSKYNASVLDCVSIWNKLYRRQFLIEKNLKFIEDMPKLQDLTFNLQVYLHAQKAVYINEELYNYRINSESVTHRYQEDIIKKFDIINENINQFVQKKNSPEFDMAYHERILNHLRTISVLYLCNKKNTSGFWSRRKEFRGLLEKEPYKLSIKVAALNYLPFKERILSFAIKHRLFLMCDILNSLQEYVMRKK